MRIAHPSLRRLCGAIVVLGLILAACTNAGPTEPLHVAAAASLTGVLGEISADFERETGERVLLSFAATGHLSQQIRNGAPFDVFAAADAEHIDALIAAGLLDASSRVTFATGYLVLVIPSGSDLELHSIAGLADPSLRRLAIANPEHAPYGIAARQALQASGLWETLQPRLIFAETVKQAAVIVGTGNAEAGLVAASVLDPDLEIVEQIATALHEPIEHVAALHSNPSQPGLAAAFLAYLTSPQAQARLRAYGLDVP